MKTALLPRKGSLPRKRPRLVLTSEPVDPADDLATPQIRLMMSRQLVVAAIRRYEESLAAARAFDASYRLLAAPLEKTSDERKAWRRLASSIDNDFETAELVLASRIQDLYEDIAPEARKVGNGDHTHFIERAVRYEGTTYALEYDVDDYEADSNIIAIVRDNLMFNLASDDE
jgi:hypothetical protein